MKLFSRRQIFRYGFCAGAFAMAHPWMRADGALGSKLADDPRRPQYHLLPPAHWMNDPNGPVYWKGNYHMFYQYNPDSAVWGDMHWGHAVSPDMVHWKHLPVALSPTPGGADADGCFSGTAVVKDGRVVVLYTGVRSAPEDRATIRDGAHSLRESQCLAYSDDPALLSWTKLPNPVITSPPQGLPVNGFRDPSPWRSGNHWLMAVGSGFPHKGGAVLLYRSTDLRQWEYLHPLISSDSDGTAAGNPLDSGDMWECPDFFPLGEKHALIYSTQGKSHWMTGSFDQKALKFHPEQSGVLDRGSYYAAKTQTDTDGSRILWGWIQETRPVEEYRAAGWACLMSLPRVLTLGGDGRLRMKISSEADKLRRAERTLLLTGNEEQRRQQVQSMKIEAACGEIACRVRPSNKAFGFALKAESGAGVGEQVCLDVRIDPASPGCILVDNEKLLVNNAAALLDMSLHIDGSVIELLVNRRVAYTKRFYLRGNHPRKLRLEWTGSISAIEKLSVWQIAPISRDRLTT